jgi:Helix-turn-helix domain
MTQLVLLQIAFDRGESLSVAEALTKYGIYALSQRCGELSRSGYPVKTDWETTASGKHIVRYSKLKVAYG